MSDFQALRIPLRPEQLDAVLAAAEREGLSHLEFLRLLIGEQADRRRERSIAHRIREAALPRASRRWPTSIGSSMPRPSTACGSRRWPRATFIGRRENLVLVGQSGVGKSRSIQAIGQSACVLGYRVRYTTSAALLADLTAALADQTLPRRLREYARFDLLIIDEFGFDRIERQRVAAGGELAVQADRRPEPAAFDGVGDEHRLRGVGRLPGRSAAGDGVPGPDRGRRDHPEDQRQVVPGRTGPADRHAPASQLLRPPRVQPRSAALGGPGPPGLRILTLLDSSGNQSPGSLLVAKVAHFYA